MQSRAQPRTARSRALARVLPWAVASAGLGTAAAGSPTLAVGAGAAGAIATLPWALLFATLVVVSSVQRWTYTVRGLTFRPDELVAAVFAIRAFAVEKRFRLGRPEWLLAGFLAVQVVSSKLHSLDVRESLRATALLGFGALAYLGTYATTYDRRRLLVATRVLLAMLAVGAFIGIAALAAYYAVGTIWGVTRLDTLGGFPASMGIAYEHDIFGSTCAAGVIAFLILWREPNPILPPRVCAAAFWLCAVGTLLSLARGAWVALVAAFVVWFVSGRAAAIDTTKRSTVSLARAGVALAAAVAAALFWVGAGQQASEVGRSTVSAVRQQAGNVLNLSASTGAHRLNAWKTALREVRSSPLLGLGTNSYGQRHFEMTQNGPLPAFLGNWAIRSLYDSGVVGLALLTAFLAYLVWPGRNVIAATGDLAPVARALTFAALALVIAYLATDALLLVWPWILLGLVRSARSQLAGSA